jgi:pimeloyl-ACP methyl ester carboxylesterase
MNSADIQLVLLPPIGSDARAYYKQASLPFRVITPKHIEWQDGETLSDHAKRYFTHLTVSGVVDLAQPVVWSGLSLGGAIAQEFSALHSPLGQVLMGTFGSNRELSPIVRKVGHVADRIPLSVYGIAGHVAPLVMKAAGYMEAHDIDLMVAGYREQDKRSFRNALRALADWNGASYNPNIPTLRIHGRKDPLIPIARIPHIDVALDTMHLITLAKPTEVNRSVTEFVGRLLA